jgi:Uma2 family endonuclease
MALAYDIPKGPTKDAPAPPPRREHEECWRRPIADLCAPIAPEGIYSDEPPMETFVHYKTGTLLFVSLEWLWRDRHDFFAAGNLTIYFSPTQLKSEDFRGPDFFVVLGTHREPLRKSWVVWDEGGKYPDVIVEVLSSSTKDVDRGLKKQTYQDVFHTPEYFLFDPETKELTGYELVGGKYQPLAPDPAGRLRSDELDLLLGIHEGYLRFFLPSGELVPAHEELGQENIELKVEVKEEARRAEAAEQHAETAEQRAETEARRAESAERRAETAEQRARLYAEKLRALGVDPDSMK